MGPGAGTGHFCPSTSVKPRRAARERRTERKKHSGRRESEGEVAMGERERERRRNEERTIPVFSIARYPRGIFIIRNLVRKTSPNSHESFAQRLSAIRNPLVHN